MTREFDKQRRDDSRPSFRKPSPNRNGEERASRPARPRLNRETVDRAWESGAQQQHADYRTRSGNTNGQFPRNGSRPYGNGNRQEQYRDNSRRFDGPVGGNQGSRPRNFDPNRRTFSDQRDQRPGPSNGYSDRPNGRSGRPDFRENNENRPYRSSGPQSRDYRDRDNQQRSFGQGSRPQRGFGQDSRPQRSFGQGNRPQQGFGQDSRPQRGFGQGSRPQQGFGQDRRPQRSFDRDSRPGRDANRNEYAERGNYQRDNRNFGRPSRPSAGRGYSGNRSYTRSEEQEFPRRPQFEGDYEHFEQETVPQRPQRSADRPFRGRRERSVEEEQPPVTRLPDGRVLKGPRPVQRKNAEFWTGINEGADDLLEHVQASPRNKGEEEHTTTAESMDTPEVEPTSSANNAVENASENEVTDAIALPTRKPRTPRTISPTTRGKKSITAKKPRSNGPKPSQRGFKWPTPPTP